MSTRVFSDPRPAFKLSDGVTPNASGQLWFYEPGVGNTVAKAVYSDAALSIAMAQPVTLNTAGICPLIYPNGDYRCVIKDSAGATLYDIPSYQQSVAGSQFEPWVSTTTYSIYDIVRGSNGNYYQSKASGNKGNDPTLTTAWVRVYFFTEYDSSLEYNIDEVVLYDNNYFRSKTNGNTGNNPNTDRTNWEPTTQGNFDAYNASYKYEADNFMQLSGETYQAITETTGNAPTGSSSTDTNWHYTSFYYSWNANYPYSVGQKVFFGDGIYSSLVDTNTGNTPSSSPSEWESIVGPTTGRIIAFKDSNTSRASTVTISDDPDLSISVPSARYKFDALLAISADSVTPDFKFQITSSDPADIGVQHVTIYEPPAAGGNVTTQDIVFNSDRIIQADTSTINVKIVGSVTVQSSTDIAISWAQNSSSVDDTILNAGSYLELTYLTPFP